MAINSEVGYGKKADRETIPSQLDVEPPPKYYPYIITNIISNVDQYTVVLHIG